MKENIVLHTREDCTEKQRKAPKLSIQADYQGTIVSVNDDGVQRLTTIKVTIPTTQAAQALTAIRGLDQSPLPDAYDSHATMTRQELLDELDKSAQRLNDMERSRDNYRRWVTWVEENLARAIKEDLSNDTIMMMVKQFEERD